MRVLPLLLFFAVLCNPQMAWAKQVFFNSQYIGNEVRFLYQWKDRHHKLNNLRFALPIAQVESAKNDFRPFSNQEANEAAFKAVEAYAKTHTIKGMKLSTRRAANGGLDVYYQAPYARKQEGQVHMRQMREIQQAALQNYITQTHYKTAREANKVMPDHGKIAQMYTAKMAPVAAALSQQYRYQGANLRAQLNHTLHFLQTIPYDELLNRYTSNGAGFQVPYSLLLSNRGDCDTKTVAFAAIARNFAPTMAMYMVYVPNHAFIALELPPKKGDTTLRIDGRTLVIADPTGPQQTNIGEPGSQARNYLRRGNYELEKIG